MIDIDTLKLRLMVLACVLLALGWGREYLHVRDVVSLTQVAQAGWGECVNHALVKLDDLEEKRRQNVGALLFGTQELEP